MAIRVAINGYGRIGRNTLRALFEAKRKDIEIVAINDLGSPETSAHLTRYDSTHGRFPLPVDFKENHLVIDGQDIRMFAQRDPALLPWGELNVDVVLECTGMFTTKEQSQAHINAGAKKVLISAPAGDDPVSSSRTSPIAPSSSLP